jgi:hypothetical protein
MFVLSTRKSNPGIGEKSTMRTSIIYLQQVISIIKSRLIPWVVHTAGIREIRIA